jgi:two-component system, OmpR family, sensor histidine kinase MtrB
MNAAAGSEDRRIGWITAFGRSDLGRAILRRLPSRVRRRVWAHRRWQHRVAAQMRSRWHRSLQLRVVVTTLLLSALVIAVLGFFLVQAIANGMTAQAKTLAASQLALAVTTAEKQSSVDVLGPPQTEDEANKTLQATVDVLQEAAGTNGSPSVWVHVTSQSFFFARPWWGEMTPQPGDTIPPTLTQAVEGEQRKGGKRVWAELTSVQLPGQTSSVPALAAGIPLGTSYQIYYVFPFTQQQQTLQLVQRVLLGVGVALVALLAAIASLVTRWVVLPVRHAAQAARKLSAGHLEVRMPVQGRDDLAQLATSFNEMAVSLQDQLHELEELSSVQRQFVSDVSHELRTPLATIRMAADVLFESKDELDPMESRSVELLQSQLERFQELLVDLLEISRYDAGAATLDAEPVDVCDLVRRSADDAQQLAERRGCRIEFRLPAEGCVAEVDRRRVERILRNILVNAVEHGEDKDVVVTAAMDSEAVAVAVRDYGVGLRPGEDQLVFDRFWRADPARARATGGTGLGLAISKEDAALHGGWLQAWGERGKGSVFRLTLPRVVGQPLHGSPLPLGPDEAEIATGLGVADVYPVAGDPVSRA